MAETTLPEGTDTIVSDAKMASAESNLGSTDTRTRRGDSSIRDPSGEWSRCQIGFRMEDSDDDGRHRPSLAGPVESTAGHTARPLADTDRVSERTVRAYIGLGANLGAAQPGRGARASIRVRHAGIAART